MKAAEIRTAFLEFFRERGHAVVSSSPVVPQDDPTLLFTNAGMNQFKDLFLGRRAADYKRAATSQKCIRAGGKHNDLENVGYTARHHTFFEMLGNFSFGDYFKAEAIEYAWTFLTRDMGLEPGRLYPTIFQEDDQAADLWVKIAGVDRGRVTRLGAKDNFWSMGETGPCGPCSEIVYDRGASRACGPACGIGRCDCDRWLEIWNLVFMQFDRDAAGKLTPLPKPSIDTGMGLERIASVIQNVDSNYETDLFQTIIRALEGRCGKPYSPSKDGAAFRVVADHLRALSFAIADGALPSNEGRGYVLRRILRRAARFGRTLDIRGPFIHELVDVLAADMGAAYPELPARAAHIRQAIRAEEESFDRTLDRGIEYFEETAGRLKTGAAFPGTEAFFLHDTCGFPVDLTALMARERGFTVDMEGFERLMDEQRERARAASTFTAAGGGDQAQLAELVAAHEATKFDPDQAQDPKVYHASFDASLVAGFGGREKGAEAALLLDRTIFYPEGGGQVGDQGLIRTPDESFSFMVENTVKQEGRILHRGKIVQGSLPRPHTKLTGGVDLLRRLGIMRAHSATHLLHLALHEVVGEHALQQGSLVEQDRLRFDFSHFQAVTPEQLEKIETRVNESIHDNLRRETTILSLDEAKRMGAMALFGEKYGAKVRMVSLGAHSKELCGGTHVQRTGDIGFFWIIREGSVASGVRRIEALTGGAAVAAVQEERRRMREAAAVLGTDPSRLTERIEALRKEVKELKKGAGKAQGQDLTSLAGKLWDDAPVENGVRVVAVAVEGGAVQGAEGLRQLADQLRGRNAPCVIFLATEQDGKAMLLAAATKDLAGRVHAGELVKAAAPKVGGGGGGRPDMAQAGGKDPAGIPAAVAAAREVALTQLRRG